MLMIRRGAHMITTYELKLSDGTTRSATTLDEVRQVAREHPDVEINPIVH